MVAPPSSPATKVIACDIQSGIVLRIYFEENTTYTLYDLVINYRQEVLLRCLIQHVHPRILRPTALWKRWRGRGRCAESLPLIVDNLPDCYMHCVMDSTVDIMIALRAGRALLGLSQEELAGLAGVSRQIVVRIEKCESNVLAESIDKVRAALEKGGVAFIEASRERGPGVAISRV